MPEHDAPEYCDLCGESDDHNHTAEEVREHLRSTTPNLRIPKAKRWGVEDKVVDGETK